MDFKIPKLMNGALFTYENHTQDNTYLGEIDFEHLRLRLKLCHERIVGYTLNPAYSSGNRGGLMIENTDTFQRFWFHVDMWNLLRMLIGDDTLISCRFHYTGIGNCKECLFEWLKSDYAEFQIIFCESYAPYLLDLEEAIKNGKWAKEIGYEG